MKLKGQFILFTTGVLLLLTIGAWAQTILDSTWKFRLK